MRRNGEAEAAVALKPRSVPKPLFRSVKCPTHTRIRMFNTKKPTRTRAWTTTCASGPGRQHRLCARPGRY
jgi:hypothetical protein